MRFFILAACLTCIACRSSRSDGQQHATQALLEIQETAASRLDSLELTGAVAAGDHIMGWTSSGVVITVAPGKPPRLATDLSYPDVVGVGVGEKGIEAFAAGDHPAILTSGGSRIAIQGLEGHSSRAVLHGGHWWVATNDSVEGRIYEVVGNTARQVCRTSAHGGSSSLSVAPTVDGLVAYEMKEPYSLFEVRDSSCSALVASDPRPALAATALDSIPPLWMALPPIRIPGTAVLIRQFSDLRSEKRLLIASRGGRVTTKLILAPMGLIGADPESQLLFAIRQVGPLEVVAYKWKLL